MVVGLRTGGVAVPKARVRDSAGAETHPAIQRPANIIGASGRVWKSLALPSIEGPFLNGNNTVKRQLPQWEGRRHQFTWLDMPRLWRTLLSYLQRFKHHPECRKWDKGCRQGGCRTAAWALICGVCCGGLGISLTTSLCMTGAMTSLCLKTMRRFRQLL